MHSCRTPPSLFTTPLSHLDHQGTLDTFTHAISMSYLANVFVGEVEIARNQRNNSPKPREFRKFEFYGCKIHGGYQLSGREQYSKRVWKSIKKTRLRVEAKDRHSVGAAFKVARLETGMTQTELGKAIGSNQATIYRWESGTNAPPVEAIKALGKMISAASREELFKVAGIVDDTRGLLQPTPETTRIPLLMSANQLGDLDPDVDSYLSLPSHWLPQGANIKAAKFANRISPIFGDELIALVDIRFRDPDRLLDCIVVARTPSGNAAMRLNRDGGTYFLVPVGEGPDRIPRVLQSEGDWSILGKVVKWIGDAPSPRK